jgi:hypothetical protein
VGGRPAFALDDPSVTSPDGPALTALDPATGQTRWTWGERQRAHLLGVADARLVVEVHQGSGRRLVAVDDTGRTYDIARWVVGPGRTASIQGSVPVQPDHIDRLEIRATSGTPLLRLRPS